MTVNKFFDTPTYCDVREGKFTPPVINFSLPKECWKYVHYETEKTYSSKEQYGLAYDAVNNYVLTHLSYEDMLMQLKNHKTYNEVCECVCWWASNMLGLNTFKFEYDTNLKRWTAPERNFINEHFALNEYAFKALIDYFEGDMLKVLNFTNNKTYLESPIK